MAFDIEDALRDGLDRTLERNALVLFAVFVAISLANTVVAQSLAQGVLESIDYQSLLVDLDPSVAAEIRSAVEEGTRLAFLDLPVAVLALAIVAVFVVQFAVKVGAIRTLVSDETERLPRNNFTRRLGWALANLIVGAILYAIAVFIGLLLFVLPGIFLAVALFFYNYEILVEDKNVFEAFSASWELTKGNRFQLFVLGLVVAILSTIVGWIAGIVGIAGPTVRIVAQSLTGAAVTVFGIAVAAQAYRQLTAEPDVENDDEVGALGPDDLA